MATIALIICWTAISMYLAVSVFIVLYVWAMGIRMSGGEWCKLLFCWPMIFWGN